MPLQLYNQYSTGYVENGSRAKPQLFGGAICPAELNFGYVHGESPARGTMKFKENTSLSIGNQLIIKLGQHTFYGLIVRSAQDFDPQTGSHRTISFVDMRDKLHNYILYAQFNMIDEDKYRVFHILPGDWRLQIKTYCVEVEKSRMTSQTVQDGKIIETYEAYDEKVPPFSAKTLLNYLGQEYDFKVSASPAAMERLETSYPNNLDFNSGIKVISAIEAIVAPLNLQFTAYGDLTIHVTMKGVADSEMDMKFLAGVMNLCNIQGFVRAQTGTELNERGRRVNIVGGRNKHEDWYPAYPAWDYTKFDFNLSTNGYRQSAYMEGKGLTPLSLVGAAETLEPKHNFLYDGVLCSQLSLRKYWESICFMAYRINFEQPLKRGIIPVNSTKTNPNPDTLFTKVSDDTAYVWNWGSLAAKEIAPSIFPVSASLVSDEKIQFRIMGTSREFENKGFQDNSVLDGIYKEIPDVARLQSTEVLMDYTVDINGNKTAVANYIPCTYDALLFFNRKMWRSRQVDGVNIFESDKIFVNICRDQEVYTFDLGDSYESPRVRTIVKNIPNIYKAYRGTDEMTFDTIDYRTYLASANWSDRLPTIKADEVAKAVAEMSLLHEYLSTTGDVTFKISCGFTPTGIIESVNVKWGPQTGTQETINFSNAINNDVMPVYHGLHSRRNALIGRIGDQFEKGNENRGRDSGDPLVAKYLEYLKKPKNDAGHQAQPEGQAAATATPVDQANAYGNTKNSALMQTAKSNIPSAGFKEGDLMIV